MSEQARSASARLAAAIDSSEEGLELFRRAAEIAASLDMVLEATVLEDRNLQHMADLPFGRTFGFSTGMTRSFDRSALSDVARSKAHRIRRAHEEVIRRFRIHCTTTNESSVSAAGAILQLVSANRFVMARGLLHSTEIVRPRRAADPAGAEKSVLVVLGDEREAAEGDLEIGLRIARVLGRIPVVLAPSALREIVAPILERRRGRASDKPIAAEFKDTVEPNDLCATAGRNKADLVVVPVEMAGRSEGELQEFLRQIGCPLLLVNRAQS